VEHCLAIWETDKNKYFTVLVHDITERSRTEEHLQFLSSITKEVSDSIIVTDTDFRIRYFNGASQDLFGYSQEEVIGETPDVFNAEPAGAEIQYEIYKTVSAGNIWTGSVLNRRKDGSAFICECKVSPLLDENGTIVSYIGVQRDITERIKAEEALKESRNFNASLLNNAPHAVIVINPDTSVRYVNPKFEEINGWTLEEIAGIKAPYPWWPEEMKEDFKVGFMEAVKQGSGNGEIIAQKKNGERYWIAINWASIMHNGELQYLLINSVDITERRQAEEALRESEYIKKAILNATPDFITVIDKEGTIIDLNEAMAKRFDNDTEKLLGRFGWDLVPPELAEARKAQFDRVFRTGEPYRFEDENRGMYFDNIVYPLPKKEGEVTRVAVVARDITERKQAEAALRKEQENFRNSIENSPLPIIIVATDTIPVYANQAYLDMFGHNRLEDLIALPREKRYTPESLVGIKERWERRIAGKPVPDNYEVSIIRKDSAIRNMIVFHREVIWNGEKHYQILYQDITERKKATEALKKSEEKFAKAFDTCPHLMSITTITEGRFIEANESHLRITGYTREELIGSSSIELNLWTHPVQRNMMIQKLVADGRVTDLEIELNTKSGDSRILSFSAEPITVNDEQCLLSVATDITERKQAEEALRESEQKYRHLFDELNDAAFLADAETGYVLDTNKQAEVLLGRTREEIIGLHQTEIHPPKSAAKYHHKFANHIQSGHAADYDGEVLRKDGSIVQVNISAAPVTIAGRNLILGLFHDITERK